MLFFKKIDELEKSHLNLRAIFEDDTCPQYVIKEKNVVSCFFDQKEAYIYLGTKAKLQIEDFKGIVNAIIASNKVGYDLFIDSFVTPHINAEQVLELFTIHFAYELHEVWNLKNAKRDFKGEDSGKKNIHLIGAESLSSIFIKNITEAKVINAVRDLQTTPHNFLNSEIYESEIKKMFAHSKNATIKSLSKSEIESEKMGLLLSVNAGSAYDPKVIVLTYKGNPSSNEHLVMVGKGITFDSGGMNIKVDKHMLGMKMDMSGSAIVAGVVKVCSDLNVKTNISAILMVTDNMISPKASKMDDIAIASNGISVEINNTDAEGRLVLADGLVYAWKHLGATKLVDVATLTGAVIVALGSTYTGVWSTNDQEWDKLTKAANEAHELVWRMPLHRNFLKFMKESKVADLRNTDYTGKAGSSSAAMFLKEFTNNLPFIHLDVAGSAGDEIPTGVMIRTLVRYATQE